MMNMPRQRYRHGFSLVEVTLALGIVGFSLVAIFGLLPFGLGVFHQAIDKTISTQIAQDLTSMVQRTPFTALPKLGTASSNGKPGTSSTTYYYDDEGTLLTTIPSSGGSGVAGAPPVNPVYRVEVYAAPAAEMSQLMGVSNTVPWKTALNNVEAIHIDIRNLSRPVNEQQKLVTYVANSGF